MATDSHFISRYLLQRSSLQFSPPINDKQPAAVLIPIIPRQQGYSVLFTQRSWQLRHHAGQVCFPGGKFDADDGLLHQTAIREMHEETGISMKQITLLGPLSISQTLTGFNIQPFIGIVDPEYVAFPAPEEVAAIFELPLAELMNSNNYHRMHIQRHGKSHEIIGLTINRWFIWGATAKILFEMMKQMNE